MIQVPLASLSKAVSIQVDCFEGNSLVVNHGPWDNCVIQSYRDKPLNFVLIYLITSLHF